MALLAVAPADAASPPAPLLRQLPNGFAVIKWTTTTIGASKFQIVALRSRHEKPGNHYLAAGTAAPDRPLMIFEKRPNGTYAALGRNDKVIATADAGGVAGNGCDPFEDRPIATKGRYFTIENAISCGGHWTDYITFRFEPRVGGFVFDNERVKTLKMNPSDDPNAEALVTDFASVRHSPKGQLVRFSQWRPPTD